MAGTYILPAPWDEDGKFWDTLEINDKEWPGKATVDVVRANKWDTKKAKGKHGGEREFNGADLAKVKIQIVLWTTEQMLSAVDLLPDIEPNPGKEAPSGVKLTHPVSIIRKVPMVTIDNVASKVTDKMMVIDIDATEHRPPDAKNATGTASGKPKGAGCDALREYLYSLYAQQNVYAAEVEAIGNAPVEFNDGTELERRSNRIAELDAKRIGIGGQINSTIVQMNALNCNGQPPSANSATTQP